MRLASYAAQEGWRAAVVLEDGGLVDAVAVAPAAGIDPAMAERGVRGLVGLGREALERLATAAADGPRLDDVRLGPPVPDAGKILCVGLNFRLHAGEAAMEEPEVPILFPKWQNALVGPGDAVELPADWPDAVDYEAEIAVVIGRRAHRVAEADALDHVAGWMPFNDVSARDLQTITTQWTAGKACDTFAPCGPHLVVDDALREGGLRLQAHVGGELRQQATSDEMIFSVAHLVSWISGFMTLEPGDVIATGTPEGVGMHRTPSLYLADGDVVTVTVGDEVLENPVRAAASAVA